MQNFKINVFKKLRLKLKFSEAEPNNLAEAEKKFRHTFWIGCLLKKNPIVRNIQIKKYMLKFLDPSKTLILGWAWSTWFRNLERIFPPFERNWGCVIFRNFSDNREFLWIFKIFKIYQRNINYLNIKSHNLRSRMYF